jgi:hypothetical protein
LAACVTGTDATETQDFLRGEPSALAGLRVAAASGDAFVFSGAAFVLSKLGEAVPVFRDGRAAAAEAAAHEEPATWSIETVCAWVSKQAFRAYKPAFRDNFVSGEMLLSLSDEDLAATLGVPNALHRRAILFAIARLSSGPAGHLLSRSPRSTAGDGGGGGGGGAASSPSASPAPSVLRIASPRAASAAAEQTYDVFLSYRRAGGADFAQLIKLLLRAEGLNVFLDVENLAVSAPVLARSARARRLLTLMHARTHVSLRRPATSPNSSFRACAARRTSFWYGLRAAWTASSTTRTSRRPTLCALSTRTRCACARRSCLCTKRTSRFRCPTASRRMCAR